MFRIEGLSKTYDDGTRALKDISFSLGDGEFVVVLGRSGSGKSTLLRCINRLIEPTTGRIFFDGREITGTDPIRLRKYRRKIGMIFQQYNLVARTSVLTNTLAGRLGYVPSWAGFINHFPAESIFLARQVLERMGIGDKIHQRVDLLSGGQQQRVGIARALMQEPALILADEPVSSLDPSSSRNIMDILREINEKDGVTLLCNLHLPDLARDYGRRVLGLKDGELVYDGPPSELDAQAISRIYGE